LLWFWFFVLFYLKHYQIKTNQSSSKIKLNLITAEVGALYAEIAGCLSLSAPCRQAFDKKNTAFARFLASQFF